MTHQSTHQNRLANAKSPYLLQHASNPVDWYEWSEEAFERAAVESKPIFLSVGYSACHWCHVLAHESFEDGEIARVMNEHFINIKVDREERPDVDRLYMTLSVLIRGISPPTFVGMTPELAPFFAGTYFPKTAFRGLCEKIATTWVDDPAKVRRSGNSVIKQLRDLFDTQPSSVSGQVDVDVALKKLFEKWEKDFDHIHAGFGDAPKKFPSPSMTFYPLLRYAYYSDNANNKKTAIDMVARTLLAINRGGINDHVGGGIARYSVDAEWRLPHFEKMLYDEAQLTISALECSMVVEDPVTKLELQKMAQDIIQYVQRDLQSPQGAFYSAEDADSFPTEEAAKKKEGAFYVWTQSEIENILGGLASIFKDYFGIQETGNVDPQLDAYDELANQNQMYIRIPISELAKKHDVSEDKARETIAMCLSKLKKYRDEYRPRPLLDDKIVTAWNGLMLSALSLAASALPPDATFPDSTNVSSKSLDMAKSIVRFTKENLWDPGQQELCRSWREGRGPSGMCEDYAAMVSGLLDLYEATGQEDHLLFALQLQQRQDDLFWDEDAGGYFASPAGDRRILIRLKDSQDGAEPSALSVSVSNLYRLSNLITSEGSKFKTKAERTLASQSNMIERAPYALGTMVASAPIGVRGAKQIIVTGSLGDKATDDVLRSIRSRFMPNRSLIVIDPDSPPTELAKHNEVVRSLVNALPSKMSATLQLPEIRICEGGVCGLPLRGKELEDLFS
ncbi:hypothetical protein K439DRAFT_1524915 [Ramaria rubella]|nr:hypothetical protein K439DRAFT_1524915 [Ramaria rubella]